MRAIWSGAVSFGLVSVPIKVYSATSSHDVRFHQVHGEDGGRIRYKRTCEVCGEEVTYADIVKGYETPEGELITLDENDLASLPVSTGHEIDVVEFVPNDQIDPMLFDKTYYLEPETKAAKPYALLREALNETDRTAVVKVALRQRETLALLRVRGKVIVLQTLIWTDEVREPDFDVLETDVELRPQELKMAASLVESMGADFDPAEFHDEYRDAMIDLIEAKRSDGDARPAPAAERSDDGADSMSDLLSALQASVDAARSSGGKQGSGSSDAESGTGSRSRTKSGRSSSRSGSSSGGTEAGSGSSGSSGRKSGSAGRSRSTSRGKSESATGTGSGTGSGSDAKPTGTRRRSRKTA
ncbi:Ku protein [Pseudonocardia sp. NPDC049635]|uniref:non-homologous end joining protein Ku n=1 Tax=Pseudonocardia sp. NPDC049635 TaxID=3155506 RepID=UPI00340C0247